MAQKPASETPHRNGGAKIAEGGVKNVKMSKRQRNAKIEIKNLSYLLKLLDGTLVNTSALVDQVTYICVSRYRSKCRR